MRPMPRITYTMIACLAAAVPYSAVHADPPIDFQLLVSVGNASGEVAIINSSGEIAGTLVDNLDSPRGTALAPDGTFYVAVTGGLGGAEGFVLRVEPDGTSSTFLTGVTPFDLEVDPISRDLFVSDAATDSIVRVPTRGPFMGIPRTFTSGFTPSGLGFTVDGRFLFAGAQPSDPTEPDSAALMQINRLGYATKVGILDNPFDVQVDSRGNVFVNNGIGFPVDGEIAVFPGLGRRLPPSSPVASTTFAEVAIRGLAIGPVGTELEDVVFASTATFTIEQFGRFDSDTFDPDAPADSTIFASGLADPFAFDIQIIPNPLEYED